MTRQIQTPFRLAPGNGRAAADKLASVDIIATLWLERATEPSQVGH
jgi:hypothetical protein